MTDKNLKSKRIYEINNLFWKFKAAYDELTLMYNERNFFRVEDTIQHFPLNKARRIDENINKKYKIVFDNLQTLRTKLDEYEFFSAFTSLDIYISNYSNGLKNFLENSYDASEQFFIKNRIDLLEKHIEDFNLLENELIFSLKMKIDFLKDLQLKDTKASVEDVKKDSITTFKAIYLLDQLGVLEHLNSRGYNDVAKSKILSKILSKNDQNIRQEIINLGKKRSNISKSRTDDMIQLDIFLRGL